MIFPGYEAQRGLSLAIPSFKSQESKSTNASNLAAFQVAIYAGHGCIYLLGCWNLISVPSEQLLYGLADVFAKLLHSIVLGASRKLAA